MSASERGIPRGNEILNFAYKGEQVRVPVISKSELKGAAASRIMPGLNSAIGKAPEGAAIGLAFIPYRYPTDDLFYQDPEAAKALMDALRAAGLPVRDEPKKLEAIDPHRADFIPYLRECRPDHYYPLDKFAESTFLMGPMTVQSIPRDPDFLVFNEAESNATKLHTESSIAIHGETILADFTQAQIGAAEIITLGTIFDSLSKGVEPYDLNQSIRVVDWI